MKLQPDTPDSDRRTIVTYIEDYIIETKEKNPKENWNTLKQLRKKIKNAIALIKRNKDGNIEIEVASEINIPTETIKKALLDHIGINEEDLDPSTWKKLPDNLIEKLKENFSQEEILFTKSWSQKGEIALSGELFRSREKLNFGDWSVQFESVEFSNVTKEPKVGADIALILHIKDSQGKVGIKTIWFQSKRTTDKSIKISSIKDLADQLELMKKKTKDSFPLLYTKKGPFVKIGSDYSVAKKYSDFIAESLKCSHGDQRMEALLDSIDRSNVFSVSIEQLCRPKKPIEKSTK